DEAQKINGKDPDFHRRDLWEAIDKGQFPEWDFFAQIFEDDGTDSYKGVDLLDPTKMIPEEAAPLIHMGTFVLNRNPDNFFAETEQVAFHPGHVVPGIDFSNDPLLQGRLFSYTDTQLSRLGGPNFHEIPINRPKCPMHNNQRDGIGRQDIVKGRVNYEPNSFQKGCPMSSPEGFKTYAQKLTGTKVRVRPDSFSDHFSQATMFFNSQTETEKNHIIEAFSFELSKVETVSIREQAVSNLQYVDQGMAQKIAENLGMDFAKVSKLGLPKNTTSPASKINVKPILKSADSLSALKSFAEPVLEGRKVCLLALDDADKSAVLKAKAELEKEKITVKVVTFTPKKRKELNADELIQMATSVEFDGIITFGKKAPEDKKQKMLGNGFIMEAFQHLKTLSFESNATVKALEADDKVKGDGVQFTKATKAFLEDLSQHKHWTRE
ncbi:MAG: catalase, partial [Bdellovibrionales bacterium]|nr:catalase [Bdellovibrionales bacterium]